MNPIFCDECKKEFIIDIKVQKLENSVERIYFTCPHCSKEYTSYYTNVLIKIKQKKLNLIVEKYNEVRGINHERAYSLYEQHENLKKEIGRNMDNLRKRVEESSK